jgi:hypothetical protein
VAVKVFIVNVARYDRTRAGVFSCALKKISIPERQHLARVFKGSTVRLVRVGRDGFCSVVAGLEEI